MWFLGENFGPKNCNEMIYERILTQLPTSQMAGVFPLVGHQTKPIRGFSQRFASRKKPGDGPFCWEKIRYSSPNYTNYISQTKWTNVKNLKILSIIIIINWIPFCAFFVWWFYFWQRSFSIGVALKREINFWSGNLFSKSLGEKKTFRFV